jgi:hypothetical protein
MPNHLHFYGFLHSSVKKETLRQTDRRTDSADRWEIRKDATVIYHVLSSVGTNRSVGPVASLSRRPGASSVTVRGCWDGQDLFTYVRLVLQWRFLTLYSICLSFRFRTAVLRSSNSPCSTEQRKDRNIQITWPEVSKITPHSS